jgi:NodT family efflux transporter outer membrane factor (OMF) lipoprotein
MSHRRPLSSLTGLAAALLSLLGGCAVGPDFRRPAPPQASDYGSSTALTTTGVKDLPGGETQQLMPGLDIPGQWWTLFHCPPLDDLIDRALKANPDVQSAQAALRVAREQVLALRGVYLPSVDAALAATRQKTSEQLAPIPSSGAVDFSLYTAQLSISYIPDVFGLNRRTVESLTAHAEEARFTLAATHLTLTSNLALAAVQEASLRAQIAATRELIAINTDSLRVLRNQHAAGYAGRLDVAAQESQLAQVEASLPPLLKQLAQQRHVLSALSGSAPDEEIPESFEFSQMQLPQELPLSLPSKLVEQRPDVRQAEENLHAASALIGVAVANRLPSITLTGNVGSSAIGPGQIFSAGTEFWGLGAGLTQPIFHGGTLLHQERAARAAYEQAAQSYRSTVLSAFQNVADTLTALIQDAEALKAAAAAERATATTLELTRRQQEAGYAGYLALLSAEQAYQQSVLVFIQARANRYADSAALLQSLGGGWWNRPDLAGSVER